MKSRIHTRTYFAGKYKHFTFFSHGFMIEDIIETCTVAVINLNKKNDLALYCKNFVRVLELREIKRSMVNVKDRDMSRIRR